jgi:hypothetical protein
MIVVSHEQVVANLSLDDCIDAVERAFAARDERSAGFQPAVPPPSRRLESPAGCRRNGRQDAGAPPEAAR